MTPACHRSDSLSTRVGGRCPQSVGRPCGMTIRQVVVSDRNHSKPVGIRLSGRRSRPRGSDRLAVIGGGARSAGSSTDTDGGPTPFRF